MPDDPCYLPLLVGAAGRDLAADPVAAGDDGDGGGDDGNSVGNGDAWAAGRLVRDDSEEALVAGKDFAADPVAAGRLVRDDVGENISAKNATYCELTGLYWAWKNLESEHLRHAEYVGLAHYRRHFAGAHALGDPRQWHAPGDPMWQCSLGDPKQQYALGDPRRRVASAEDVLSSLGGAEVLLPKPRHYYIETNWSQYVHAHHEQDLQLTREIIGERNPKLLRTFDAIMARTWGHRFNMFVMHREFMREWCEWLFGVLFELEARLDISGYNPYDARVFGFVAERLMDVWVEGGGLSVAEMSVVNLESQHWLRKGGAFIRRKVVGHPCR